MMVIDPKFKIGELIYLKTDTEQKQRLVYAYIVYENDILYRTVCGTYTSDHYGMELSMEKNIILTTTN